MAKLIRAKSANELWIKAKRLLDNSGNDEDSRCGDNIEVLNVLLELSHPREKWCYKRFPPMSISNALAEVLWILGGRNDSKFINFWNPGLKNYAADDGSNIYHGAYGYRLIENFEVNQLERAYLALKNNPDNRQTVMIIWDPKLDLPKENGIPRSNDIPCNVCSLLKVRDNKLIWTQIMRSNDLYLGMPYNLVQFTCLQEIMAGWLELDVGNYNHYSDSLHLYKEYKHQNVKIDDIKCIKDKNIINNDNLSIPKGEFDNILKIILIKMDKMFNSKPSEDELLSLATLNSTYMAYNNIVYVIGAYASKKYNYSMLTRKLLSKCTNSIYIRIWDNWIKYLELK